MPLIIASLLALAAATPATAAAPTPPPATAEIAHTTAAGAANVVTFRSWQRSTAQALSHSADPRDRALASDLLVFVSGLDRHGLPSQNFGALLREAAKAAPSDALIQFMWAQSSPLTSGCDRAAPCPERAQAMARLQPDNAVAWVPVVAAAWKAGDAAAIDAALARMAQATGHESPLSASLPAWLDVIRRYPLPRSSVTQEGASVQSPQAKAFQVAMAMSSAQIPAYDGLIRSCDRAAQPRASAARFADCARIGRNMLTHADELIDRNIGSALLRRSRQATAADVQTARDNQWQQDQWNRLVGAKHDAAIADRLVADWRQVGNEVGVMKLELTRAGIPLQSPANWQLHDSHGRVVPPLGNVMPENVSTDRR